ncbi:MAG: bifunctional glutamate N-acetyltransferase/amino-acid acetyltransferase ArgJ [Pseudomonadota bacterium]
MAVGLNKPTNIQAVKGIRLAVTDAGIRYKDRNDLVLIEICEQSQLAAVFTKNKFRAAPVELSLENLSKAEPRYLVINAGNANAGTGQAGFESALDTTKYVAAATNVSPAQVLPFSTGVIGELLDANKIKNQLSKLVNELSEDKWIDAAQAIMTTDTVAKANSQMINLQGKEITITGITKGAGMIQPNMATMLSYIASDIQIDKSVLKLLLTDSVDNSFNSITVDSDTSTNDACVLIATGASGLSYDDLKDDQQMVFKQALQNVMDKLAQSIIRDGEGASKYVVVNVLKALTKQQARDVAFSVANSPLVKTALAASDPNWGRIMAAVGKVDDKELRLENASLSINDVIVWNKGQLASDYNEDAGKQAMLPQDIKIEINLGLGSAFKTVWTTDLTHEYVRINAEYRT